MDFPKTKEEGFDLTRTSSLTQDGDIYTANNASPLSATSSTSSSYFFSVVSIGLSGVYGGSRTLTALAEQGYAPKIFAYVDRRGPTSGFHRRDLGLWALGLRSASGVYGSWVGLTLIILVLIAQFYTAVKPLDAYSFFQAHLAAPVVLAFYIIDYMWKRKAWLKTSEIDVDSVRREVDHEHAEKLRAQMANWSAWCRVLERVF
ncbi:hypothetical protein B0A55_01243 [Friedmanniomyces simplex]|uniref:Amino acid permease/ SLC12A domain-containing protein n=1 Tax=Friedmanniomyces simplex TaxID=329884 RepID=A0A4U0XZQ5_9PEZI|nr:hypothetical protein B0A55_01243 [Friedmanniomyces simplex]